MSRGPSRIVIVGGGLAGSLLAVLLARRGLAPLVLERDPPFTDADAPRCRSINLALAARGIAALSTADAYARVAELAMPMRGRMVHEIGASPNLAPYGRSPSEQIYSVSRAALHLELYRIAAETHGVEFRFRHECIDTDDAGVVATTPDGRTVVPADVVIACDGAGSNLRRALADAGRIKTSETLLDHGYREFHMPPGDDGTHALDPNALHIWPRGGFMLIALPNLDGSFTATLFLPLEGPTSFDAADTHGIRARAADGFAAATGPSLCKIPAARQGRTSALSRRQTCATRPRRG
jgi:kynurenine 3-monooxygenase